MTLKKFDQFKDFQDVKKAHEDLKANFSFDDISFGDLKTTAPTTSTLDKGRFRVVEEANVPVLYVRATNGTLYKSNFTLA